MPKELTSNFNANSLAVVELCQRLAEENDDKQKKKQNKWLLPSPVLCLIWLMFIVEQ